MIKRTLMYIIIVWTLVFVSACGTLDVEVENPGKEVLAASTPTAESLLPSSPPPVATDVVETPAPPPASPVHPAAGVVYNTAEGLWSIDAQGNPVLLLDEPDARLSPDGTQAVYVDAGEGADDVWLVDLASEERRNLTNTADRFEENPLWWPGMPGTIICGSDTGRGMENAGYPTVVGVDHDIYQVLDPDEGGPLALSRETQMIAYGGFDNLGKIYRWGIGPEVFDPTTYGLAVEKLYQPAWAPDGRHLAWKVGGDLTGEGTWQMGVAVFDLQAETAQLFHVFQPVGGMFPHYLTWSPDGDHLAFVTFQEPPATGREPNLWLIDAETGDEVYVGAGADPVWSPDGGRLAFSLVGDESASVAVAEADTGQLLDVALPSDIRAVSGWIDPK